MKQNPRRIPIYTSHIKDYDAYIQALAKELQKLTNKEYLKFTIGVEDAILKEDIRRHVQSINYVEKWDELNTSDKLQTTQRTE